MNIDQAGRFALELMKEWWLKDWIVEFRELVGGWGRTDLDAKLIVISDKCPESEMEETIKHEIAHAICEEGWYQGHGTAWVRCAEMVGCKRIEECRDDISPNYPTVRRDER